MDDFEHFWRPQGTPEQIAQQRRERAQQILDRSQLMQGKPQPSAPERVLPKGPVHRRIIAEREAQYQAANFVNIEGACMPISKVLARQLGYDVDHEAPLPPEVSAGDDPEARDD